MAKTTYVKSARVRMDAEGIVKPNYTCDKCSNEIKPGTSYKWKSIKTGPASSRKLIRCANCPEWHIWECSDSLSARTAQIAYDCANAIDDAGDQEAAEEARDNAAEAIKALAEEKRESASNIESGFQHETYQSQELNEQADQLEEWANEIEQAEIPELPEPDEDDCPECEGDGKVTEDCSECTEGKATGPDGTEVDCTNNGCDEGQIERECDECSGSGEVEAEEPNEEQYEEWREAVREALSMVDECPV